MKTLTVLNIGLETTKGNRVEIHHAINEIQRAGLQVMTSCVVHGMWEGKPEETLVVSGLAYDSPELRPRLYSASRALSQHCIAVYANGKGELIGDNPNAYEFDLSLFHFHPEGKPVLSECERMQAKHATKAESVKDETAENYIAWLESTLLPDLDNDGFEATANSFRELIHHYRNK